MPNLTYKSRKHKKNSSLKISRPNSKKFANVLLEEGVCSNKIYVEEPLFSPFDGDETVSIDEFESLANEAPKRKVKAFRRRQIDPTTCERDYDSEEVEFMNALDEYKRKNGRMFPTCSEILEVIKSLGYVKQNADIVPIDIPAPEILHTPLAESKIPMFDSPTTQSQIVDWSDVLIA